MIWCEHCGNGTFALLGRFKLSKWIHGTTGTQNLYQCRKCGQQITQSEIVRRLKNLFRGKSKRRGEKMKVEMGTNEGATPFFSIEHIDGRTGKQKLTITGEHRVPTGQSFAKAWLPVKKGKEEFVLSLNRTNLRAIVTELGDDSADWINKSITAVKIKVRNPTTNKIVDSFAVQVGK